MNGWGYREGEWREIVGNAAFLILCVLIPAALVLWWAS